MELEYWAGKSRKLLIRSVYQDHRETQYLALGQLQWALALEHLELKLTASFSSRIH